MIQPIYVEIGDLSDLNFLFDLLLEYEFKHYLAPVVVDKTLEEIECELENK